MPRRPKSDTTQLSSSKALPPIQHSLSTRQQREILRYAANFAVDTVAVVREIQAVISPAVERAVMDLVAASDAYERARADHERSLRARFRGVDAKAEMTSSPPATLTPAGEADDVVDSASFAHSGM